MSKEPEKGDRIRFDGSSDPYTKLTPGTMGRVTRVAPDGTISVAWEDGSSLKMIPGEDSFEIMPPAKTYADLNQLIESPWRFDENISLHLDPKTGKIYEADAYGQLVERLGDGAKLTQLNEFNIDDTDSVGYDDAGNLVNRGPDGDEIIFTAEQFGDSGAMTRPLPGMSEEEYEAWLAEQRAKSKWKGQRATGFLSTDPKTGKPTDPKERELFDKMWQQMLTVVESGDIDSIHSMEDLTNATRNPDGSWSFDSPEVVMEIIEGEAAGDTPEEILDRIRRVNDEADGDSGEMTVNRGVPDDVRRVVQGTDRSNLVGGRAEPMRRANESLVSAANRTIRPESSGDPMDPASRAASDIIRTFDQFKLSQAEVDDHIEGIKASMGQMVGEIGNSESREKIIDTFNRVLEKLTPEQIAFERSRIRERIKNAGFDEMRRMFGLDDESNSGAMAKRAAKTPEKLERFEREDLGRRIWLERTYDGKTLDDVARKHRMSREAARQLEIMHARKLNGMDPSS
ncbi:MAG: DUF4314 domain-containing protein, partial [Gammaproteobacteria bacterium]|nr:DUF4314 domain-containing protein [Gammaproteobacteria bacterium]